jgi:hypothetical protein
MSVCVCAREREREREREKEPLKRTWETLSDRTDATLKVRVVKTFLQPVLLDKPTNSQVGGLAPQLSLAGYPHSSSIPFVTQKTVVDSRSHFKNDHTN